MRYVESLSKPGRNVTGFTPFDPSRAANASSSEGSGAAIYPLREFCEAGGLVSYGVLRDEMIADAAPYVDRILRGADPAALPVQAPTQFELVVNQKVGRHLPLALLAQAEEVLD
ncbi:MAG: ABC transporter substrate binding protein [Reyranellaceae bacterium]